MTEIYDHIWKFPLMGGIISLIALFTPAAYLYESDEFFNLWMWGLLSIKFYDPYYGDYSSTAFSDNIYIITPSAIFSIIIGLSTLVLISSAITCKKDLKAGSGIRTNWLTPMILIIFSTVGWIISIELTYLFGPSSMSFWEYIHPGFGIVGMFLGSVIVGVGHIVFKRVAKRREVIIFNTPQKRTLVLPIALSESESIIKFCPECGMEVTEEIPNYCTSCGFKLK